jgi:hypothetical protein
MSTIVMAACWPLQMPSSPKAVLISLADQANDHGYCWPSIATISVRTCLSERTVQTAIRWLERAQVLRVEIGAMKANRYTLSPADFTDPDASPGVSTSAAAAPPQHLHPRSSCTPPPQQLHPNRHRTVKVIPPIPPKGATLGLEGVEPKRKLGPMSLKAWLAECAERGEKPIPPTDPVWRYAERVGLPHEFVALAWWKFKRRREGKRQSDWRQTFRNCVEDNWYRLWYIGDDGRAALTTQGQQAKADRDAQERGQ